MEQRFNKLVKEFKIKLIIAILVFIIVSCLLLALSIIYKKLYLYAITFGCFLVLLPILILLFNIGFNKKKDDVLTGILNEENCYGFDIKLYGKVEGKEVEILKLYDYAQFFSISNIISYKNDTRELLAYTVKFEVGKKRVVGKVIRVDYDSKPNKEISDSYLKNANYLKRIKVVDNSLYIFVSDYMKNKTSKAYSLEILDYKTYNDIKNRVDKELLFLNELLEK